MIYFTQDYIDFFTELNKNNQREWFHANKKRYEKSVKIPFATFINDLISAVSDLEEPIPMEAKDAIFRINRDIRFSADKSPYKDHMAAIVSPYGKKDHTHPGIYIQANHIDVRLYSGCHSLDKNQLQQLREYIAEKPDEFESLISDAKFVKTFGEIRGEKNKRIPKELIEAAEKQPLIYNKSFYFFKSSSPEILLKKNLIKDLMDSYSVSRSLRLFLNEGIG